MSNRQWLKSLAASERDAWSAAPIAVGMTGRHRLDTRRTIYMFEDGECVEVARRGNPDEEETAMVGMRLVGWLIEIEGRRRMLTHWLPGARAVLWRHAESRIALTSPSFGLVSCSDESLLEDDDADETLELVRERPSLPPHATATGSFTRFAPAP